MKMLYLIGEPGVGKTTVVRRLVRQVPCQVMQWPYVAWTHYTNKLAQLGYDRDTFGGTDALGMAAQKHVLGWVGIGGTTAGPGYRLVLAEGDRLANDKFFQAVQELEVDLTVALLQAPREVLAERRAKRNREIGKSQDERWLRTRNTKVSNLAERWVDERWVLDATQPPQQIVNQLARQHPVAREFLRLRKKLRANR